MLVDAAQFKADLLRIEAKQDEILSLLKSTRRPHLTVRDFAKEAGFSERYIHEELRRRVIHKVKGRIPAKFLERYTSPTAA